MELNRKYWLVKWWMLSYDFFGKRIPKQTSLCAFVWRCLIFTLFFPIFIAFVIMALISWAVIFVFLTAVYFFLGIGVPKNFYPDDFGTKEGMKNYPIKFNGHSIALWQPTVIVGFIWLNIWGFRHHAATAIFSWSMLFAIAAIIILLRRKVLMRKSQTLHLIGKFAKAKKEKICPIITFKES